MTTKQIQAKATRQAKAACKANEILETRVEGNNEMGFVYVKMQSTCEAGESMTWTFMYDYEEGNGSVMTAEEKIRYADILEEPKLSVRHIN